MKIAGFLTFKFIKVGLFLAAVSVAMVGPSIEIAIAASTPLACQPYEKGKLRETLPTFFCLKREDANALIELMDARRLEKIFQKRIANPNGGVSVDEGMLFHFNPTHVDQGRFINGKKRSRFVIVWYGFDQVAELDRGRTRR